MNNHLDKSFAAFKAKTEKMTVKELLVDYIWEYYKFHIIVTFIALYLLGSGINSAFINPPVKPFAAVGFYEAFISADTAATVENELTDVFVPGELQKRQGVLCYPFTVNPADPQVSSANQMKFVAMVTAKELDILICDKDSLDIMIRDGLTVPLDTVFTEKELAALSEDLIRGDMLDADDNAAEIIGAVDLGLLGGKVLKPLGYSCGDKYIALIPGSPRAEDAEAVFKYILGME